MNTIRNKHNGITSKPGTMVHVKGNYVTQYITIQSGCSVHITPQGTVSLPQQEVPVGTAAPLGEVALSRIEQAFQAGIRAVLDAGQIQNKQDFRVIHQIVLEMKVYDRLTLKDLLSMLNKVDIPKKLMPSLNNLKCITFVKGRHPEWKVNGCGPEETARLVQIATVFKQKFQLFLTGH